MDHGGPESAGEADPASDAGEARRVLREWLVAHPQPSGRELAGAGYAVPHWPPPWGLGAGPPAQLAIDEVLRSAGIRRPVDLIGIGWAGPTLLEAGTPEQKDRWLPPLLAGEELWCQLFSEPEAGSDLASLTTRAVRDGDEWVVTGQKVWTSYAHVANWGILLARTDPEAPRQQGISYFVCPMDAPGVEVRPLVDMTGAHAFNEVYLDQVRLPADHLLGQLHDGWRLAKVTLGNERVSLSGDGTLWGRGPTATDLVDLVRAAGGAPTAPLRQRLAQVWIEGEVLRVLRLRTVSAVLAGRPPGPEASVRKALADAHGQHVMTLGRDLAGAFGTLAGTGPIGGWGPSSDGDGDGVGGLWAFGFPFSAALTIGGGTAEVQRNIVAERVLGLPREGP